MSKAPLLKELGGRVRRRRKHLGLTQEEVAHRAGLHWTYIGQCERGERNLSILSLLRVAKGLDCDPGGLLKGMRIDS